MRHLYCSLFGHDYKLHKNVTHHVKEYRCRHCNEHLTTDGQGRLTPMAPKYKDINSTLERIHTSRRKRRQLMLDR